MLRQGELGLRHGFRTGIVHFGISYFICDKFSPGRVGSVYELEIRTCRSVLVDICVLMGKENVISEDVAVAVLPKMASPYPGINQSVQVERSPKPSPVCVETYSSPKSVAEVEKDEIQTGMSAENLYSSVSPPDEEDQAVIPPSRTWSSKQSFNEKKGQAPESSETEICKGRKPSVVKVLSHQFDVDQSTLNNESYPNTKIDSFNANIQEAQVQDDSKDSKSNFADVESMSGHNDELYRNQSLAFVDAYDADIMKIREVHQEQKNEVKPSLDENYAEIDDVLDALAPSMIDEGQKHGVVLGILTVKISILS